MVGNMYRSESSRISSTNEMNECLDRSEWLMRTLNRVNTHDSRLTTHEPFGYYGVLYGVMGHTVTSYVAATPYQPFPSHDPSIWILAGVKTRDSRRKTHDSKELSGINSFLVWSPYSGIYRGLFEGRNQK